MHQQLEGLQRKPLLPGTGMGVGGGWCARGASTRTARTPAPTHTRVLSHTYEGISLNGIQSILRCPFLNGTSVKGKDTYVNNVFHTGLSGPATLGAFSVENARWFKSELIWISRVLCNIQYKQNQIIRSYNWTLYAREGWLRMQISNQFPVKTLKI